MQDNRLVLYPRNPRAIIPDNTDLVGVLREIGLVGETFEWQGELHYVIGQRFLELVSFLGCSPFINIEPQDDGSEFCHIALALFDVPQLLAGDNARPPRCPACKQELPGWRDWCTTPLAEHSCPHCGASMQLAAINWRRTAAVASAVIYIYGVHDSEAVPSELLLSALERLTGLDWAYFYLQHR